MGMSGSGSIFSIGHQYGGNEAVNIALLTSVVNGTVPERGFKRKAEYAAKATFPIRATDLMPELAGSSLGEKLAELRQICMIRSVGWIGRLYWNMRVERPELIRSRRRQLPILSKKFP